MSDTASHRRESGWRANRCFGRCRNRSLSSGAWYGKVFAAAWARLTGVAPADSAKARTRNMIQLLIANGLTALGLAFAIAIASEGFNDDSVSPALLIGFIARATLSATTLLQHNAFELKPLKLTVLNNAYRLVLFLAMALVIGLM
jgi:hypothetical protein